MKCQKCGGSGEIKHDWLPHETCHNCNGTGYVNMTNEEWLRSATFEELAGAIYEWYTLGFTRGKNGKKLNSITEVVEWLKEIHHG